MADSTRFSSETRGRAGSAPGASQQDRGFGNIGKDVGNELVEAARERVGSVISEQKDRAADQIRAVASILRGSMKPVEQAGLAPIAHYADEAADQIAAFADRLRRQSWDELATDAGDFARRWPAVFLTCAFGAGIVAGRFMIASAARAQSERTRGGPASRSGDREGANSRPTPSDHGTTGGSGHPETHASASGTSASAASGGGRRGASAARAGHGGTAAEAAGKPGGREGR